jgi:hypothetical protein
MSTWEICFELTRMFCCGGLALATLEYLSVGSHFASDGIFAWQVLRTRYRPIPSVLLHIRDKLYSEAGVKTLLWTRLLLLVLALIPNRNPYYSPILFGSILIVSLVFNYRLMFGTDGSDYMLTILLVGLTICSLPYPGWRSIGFCFIAAQSVLSYLTAGVAKARSRTWRSGEAICNILDTATYGSRIGVGLLKDSRLMQRAVCWATILFECTFPLVLLAPRRTILLFFGLGIMFHVLVSVFMGLNNFVWAYLGTYPAIWLTRSYLLGQR